MTDKLLEKYEALRQRLKSLSPLAIAYSGGVDSTLLLKICVDMGLEIIAINAVMPFVSKWEQEYAQRFADEANARLIQVEMDVLESPRIAKNPRERCYYCKRGVFSQVLKVARAYGMQHLADGTNADDAGTLRPGLRAAEEFGVHSPLKEAGITKADARAISEHLKLATASRPSSSCLATRIPYGTPITLELLQRIERSEDYLRELGFEQVRVRVHGYLSRIEIPRDEIQRFVGMDIQAVCETLKGFGNGFITLDLQGIRSGSMDIIPD